MCPKEPGYSGLESPPDDPVEREDDEQPQDCDEGDFVDEGDIEVAEKDYEARIHGLK